MTATIQSRDRALSDPDDAARDFVFLALLLSPAFVATLPTIRIDSDAEWLLLTYVSDATPLVLLAVAPRYWWTVRECAGRRVDFRWALAFVPIFVVCAYAISLVEISIQYRFVDPVDWAKPLAADRPYYWIDQTFGLALTAISEETVYRGVFAAIAFRHGRPTWLVVLLSSAIFAAAHWHKGVANVIAVFLIGLLLVAMYLKTRSIWPGIATHAVYDFIVFA